MTRRRFVLSIAAVVVAGLAGLYIHHLRTTSEGNQRLIATAAKPKASPASQSRPQVEAAPGPVKWSPTSTAHPEPALPPIGTPLVQVYDTLLAQAMAGSARASCRLAHELHKCGGLAGRLRELEKRFPSLAQDPHKREGLRAVRDRLVADQQVCDGFVDDKKVSAWALLYHAALAGHVPSMARFAIAPPMHPLEFALELEGWAAYRENASRFLHAAADAGYPPAVRYLAVTYAGDLVMPRFNLAGVELAPTDYARAGTYAHAASRISTDRKPGLPDVLLERIRPHLAPQQLAVAEGEAQTLVARWPPEAFEPVKGAVPGQVLPAGGHDCEY